MLNYGIQVNASVEVPENHHEKIPLLHRALYCRQVEVVRLTVNGGAEINFHDTKKTLFFTLMLNGVVWVLSSYYWVKSVNLTNKNDYKTQHIYAKFGHLEATSALV